MSEMRYAEIVEQSVSDDVDWDDFRVFLEVIRHGSFNRAANKLKMTQPTVSRRLLRLEKAIGVRLFDRDRRGPRLTHEGQRIFSDASAAQAALLRAANQASGVPVRVDGDCKISMSDGIASYWMTRFLGPFFDRYPNIDLKLSTAQESADKRETFDLSVNYFEPADPDAVSTRVATMHFIPFGSRAYFERHGTPQKVEDLSRHRLLDLTMFLADMGSWASWSREEATTRTVLFTNLSSCLGEAVRYGAGIALLPTYAMLVDEALVPLDIGVRFQAPIFVNYMRDGTKKWAVRATIDFLSSVVFNRNEMPWFSELYVPPVEDWRQRGEALIRRASEPLQDAEAE